jgi:hypothetical protein
MGIASCKNLCAAAGLTASKAAIPLWEIARLMERCWEAALEEGRRRSVGDLNKDGKGLDLSVRHTRTAFIHLHTPAMLGKREGG